MMILPADPTYYLSFHLVYPANDPAMMPPDNNIKHNL